MREKRHFIWRSVTSALVALLGCGAPISLGFAQKSDPPRGAAPVPGQKSSAPPGWVPPPDYHVLPREKKRPCVSNIEKNLRLWALT